MAQGKQALKSRIRSVNATKKITSAMELIANSKLLKQRIAMEKNREYATTLQKVMGQILSSNPDVECRYLQQKTATKKLTFVFTSDLGLCGGYNANMQRYATEYLDIEDPIIVIGTKGKAWYARRNYQILNDSINGDNVTHIDLNKLADKALTMFENDEIGTIQILYTRFVNAVTFIPEICTLLPVAPLEKTKQEVMQAATIFEPSPSGILDALIPMFVRSLLYSTYLQTKTAEQGTRRIAMENATDNAEELTEQLVLQYNQARQAAITQEITEIVAGADAL